MNRQDIIDFLSKNLSIHIDEEPGYFSPNKIVVKLFIGDDEISKDYLEVPTPEEYSD